MFEGVIYDGEQVCEKAKEEAELWGLAQTLEGRSEGRGSNEPIRREVAWRRPTRGVVKCNIGMEWSKKEKSMGASCVLRDSNVKVLLHSRRSFGLVWSKDEAYFLSLVWAVESMISHGCLRVYFGFEGRVLVNALNRPKSLPSFRFEVNEIKLFLRNFLD